MIPHRALAGALCAVLLLSLCPATPAQLVSPGGGVGQPSSARADVATKAPPIPVPPRLAEHATLTSDASVLLEGRAPGAYAVRVQWRDALQLAPVSGGRFSIDVPLQPDRAQRIVLTSLALGGTESAPLTTVVVRDEQAPILRVLHPSHGDVVTTDTVTVVGEVLDVLAGSQGLVVTVAGRPAQLSPGIGGSLTFLAEDIALTRGPMPVPTLVTVQATDALGNVATQQLSLTSVAPEGPRLLALSGDLQVVEMLGVTADPLVVRVELGDGSPLPGKTVEFELLAGGGGLSIDGEDEPRRVLQLTTDVSGEAAVFVHADGQAAAGGQLVRVRSAGVAGSPTFATSSGPGPPTRILLAGGDGQRNAPRGTLADPLAVWVTDGHNGVPDVLVTFTLTDGEASLPQGDVTHVFTDAEGRASVPLVLGQQVGPVTVLADFTGNRGQPVTFSARADAAAFGKGATTRLAGLVLDATGRPLDGATVTVAHDGEVLPPVLTDAGGAFRLTLGKRSGLARVTVDGATAFAAGELGIARDSHPSFAFDVTLLPGVVNRLPRPVALPRLDASHEQLFDGTLDAPLQLDDLAGLELRVLAGSMLTGEGLPPSPSSPAVLSLDVVHADGLPAPLPDGALASIALRLGPDDASFDPPVEVALPNVTGLPPDSLVPLLAFDPARDAWQTVALARVSADATTIATPPGEGLPRGGYLAPRLPSPAAGRVVGTTDAPPGCPTPSADPVAAALIGVADELDELVDARWTDLPAGTPAEQAAWLAQSLTAFGCATSAAATWQPWSLPLQPSASAIGEAGEAAGAALLGVLAALQTTSSVPFEVELLTSDAFSLDAPLALDVTSASLRLVFSAPAPLVAVDDAAVVILDPSPETPRVALLSVTTVESPQAVVADLLLLSAEAPTIQALVAGRVVSAPFAGEIVLENVPADPDLAWRARVLQQGVGATISSAADLATPVADAELDLGVVPRASAFGVSGLSASAADTLLESPGQTTWLTATAFQAGSGASDVSSAAQGTTWSSSDARVASVDASGLATAVGDGQVLLAARHDGLTATIALDVSLPVESTVVTGFVRRANGSFVADAQVTLEPGDHVVTTDGAGRFEITGVAADQGPLTLLVRGDLASSPKVGRLEDLAPRAGAITDAGFVVLADAVFWAADVSGNWNDPLRWSTGVVPGPSDEVVIHRPSASVTVTKGDSGAATVASLFCSEAFDLHRGSLVVGFPLVLDAPFSISGATLRDTRVRAGAGGPISISELSILDGVILDCDLQMLVAATLRVIDGLHLSGSVLLGAQFVSMEFSGTQTLAGTGEVVFSSPSIFADLRPSSGTLTIGPGITIRGNNGRIGDVARPMIVQGRILSDAPGLLVCQGAGWTNEGLLEAAVGTVESFGTWTSPGSLLASGGSLWLNATGPVTGPVATSAGGTIRITGSVQNAGHTLTVADPGWRLDGGTIAGGTIASLGGEQLTVLDTGTLSGVTLSGLLDFTNPGVLTITNGLQLDGTLRIDQSFAAVVFAGTQTLSGSGEVVFDAPSFFTDLRASSGTLTIGPDVTIRGNNGRIGNTSLPMIVQGRILSDAPGILVCQGSGWTNDGLLEAAVGTVEPFGTWTSPGELLASGGSIWLNATGPVTGPIATSAGGTIRITGNVQNTGNTLTVADPGWRLDGGTISGGTIASSGGEALTVLDTGTLSGVTLSGLLDFTNPGVLTITNGLQVDGTLRIDQGFASVVFAGTQTLSGTGEVVFDVPTFFTDLRPSGGTLTIGPDVTIRGNNGRIGDVALPMVVQGRVLSDSPGILVCQGTGWTNDGLLEAAVGTVESFGTWTSPGELLASGGSLWLNATGPITGPITTSAGGTVRITGDVQNAGHTLTIADPGWQLDGGTISGGTIASSGGDGLSVLSISALVGVTLQAPLGYTVGSRVDVTDGLVLEDVITLPLVGATLEFVGAGTLTGQGEVHFTSTSTNTFVRARVGDSLTIGADVIVHGASGTIGQSGASLINAGTIVSDVPGTLVLRGSAWQNTGTLSAAGGNLSTNDSWTNDGLAVCGAHDTFTANTLTQSASGTLRVELAGTAAADYGALAASGTTSLDGTLEVVLVEGFVPVIGNSFTVLTAGSRSGNFASTVLPPEVSWSVTYGATSVTLTVVP